MSIDGKLGDVSYNDQRARGGHHPAVILAALLGVATGTLPVGLIVARDKDKKLIAFDEDIEVVVAEGDGSEKTFTFDLGGPVEPGSVVIDDEVEAFSDDGFGTLTGDQETDPGSGKMDYSTGKGTVTFKTAPINEKDIVATWTPIPTGVLDETVDAAKTGSALYIPHGSVLQEVLKVPDGSGGYEAPDAAMLATLAKIGIYAE